MIARRDLERTPTSPGEHIREFLSLSGVSQEDFAAALRVTRLSVNQLVNDRRVITPDMAMRLAALTGISARHWLTLQLNYQLSIVEARWSRRQDLQWLRAEIEAARSILKTSEVA